LNIEIHCMCQVFKFETLDINLFLVGKQMCALECWLFSGTGVVGYSIMNRDETIWRYIDTVSIRRLTIRIVAQRDISRYDLDINFVIRRSHHVVFFVFGKFFVFVQEIYSLWALFV